MKKIFSVLCLVVINTLRGWQLDLEVRDSQIWDDFQICRDDNKKFLEKRKCLRCLSVSCYLPTWEVWYRQKHGALAGGWQSLRMGEPSDVILGSDPRRTIIPFDACRDDWRLCCVSIENYVPRIIAGYCCSSLKLSVYDWCKREISALKIPYGSWSLALFFWVHVLSFISVTSHSRHFIVILEHKKISSA